MWTEAAVISGGCALLLVGLAVGLCFAWADRDDLRAKNESLAGENARLKGDVDELVGALEDATREQEADMWGGSPLLGA